MSGSLGKVVAYAYTDIMTGNAQCATCDLSHFSTACFVTVRGAGTVGATARTEPLRRNDMVPDGKEIFRDVTPI